MWFLVETKNQDKAFDVELVSEKILVDNIECYVAVLGDKFSKLADSRKEEAIGKIISFYYQFSVFVVIDRLLSKKARRQIVETLGKFAEEFNRSYQFETPEFLKKSNSILEKFIPRIIHSDQQEFTDALAMDETFFDGLPSPKEDSMEIKDLVKKTMKGSISYLLLKNGKVVDKKNISMDEKALKGFAFATRLPLILSKDFIKHHGDLGGQSPLNMSLINRSGDKSLLIKTLADGYNLFLQCEKAEIPQAEKALEELSSKL